jgi:DNA ligase D-like protein (predicted 3'-phosphoesterase)
MGNKLGEYKRKRNFDHTNEPAEGGQTHDHAPIYVIQRHDASTLHYDVRLEVDGVLKSWAVPKGPPEKAGERHLAVPTEDHPMAYASFSGRIPEGQYGAGTVEIWDRGTYRNLRAEDDGEMPMTMAQSLDDGKVEVLLRGKTLNGPYALIRLETDDDEEPRWLMIKMKDQPAEK